VYHLCTALEIGYPGPYLARHMRVVVSVNPCDNLVSECVLQIETVEAEIKACDERLGAIDSSLHFDTLSEERR